MRTGARRVAGFQIDQQCALLVVGESLSRLDCHPLADTRRKFGLDLILQGRLVLFEILHQGAQRSGRVTSHEQDRHGADLEGVGAKFLHVETEVL